MVYRILGIGDSACETAANFRQEKNYSVDLITDEMLGQHANMEEYEKKFVSKSVAKAFRKYRKADEVLIIINGASSANGAALRIAQMIKKCRCSILFLAPSQAWSTPEETTNSEPQSHSGSQDHRSQSHWARSSAWRCRSMRNHCPRNISAVRLTKPKSESSEGTKQSIAPH